MPKNEYAPWVAKYGLQYEYGLCQCGCGEKTAIARWTKSTKGIAKGKPYRYINGHSRIVPIATRFWQFVTIGTFDECWLWQGGVNASGYGIMWAGGRAEGAHRISWEIHFGPIPDGSQVLHKCDVNYASGDFTNRRCVNPHHLWLGTNQENNADMMEKSRDRHINGESHHAAKLTKAQVLEIRSLCAQGMAQPEIAERFGISQTHVSAINLRKVWRHIR